MSENSKLDMSLDEIIRIDGIKGARKMNNRRGGNDRMQNRNRPYNNRNNFRQFGGNGNGPKRLNSAYNRTSNNRNSDHNRNFRTRQSNGESSFGGSRGYNRSRNATLHVSNLALTVNSEDIEELFSTFGMLTRSFVHYDQYGTSLGTAEVVFERRDEAMDARNKLNGVPLDGKPLRIVLVEDDDDGDDIFSSYIKSSTQRNNQNNNRNSFQNRGGNRQNGGSGNGGGARRQFNNRRNQGGDRNRNNNNNNSKAPPSADDLDRELDEWRMQAENGDEKVAPTNDSVNDSLLDEAME